MQWFFLFLSVTLATQLWLCFRVARSSVGWAVATFFFGSFGAAYPAFKEHGKEETSVTLPFIVHLVCATLLAASAWLVAGQLMGDEQEEAVVEEAAEQVSPSPGNAPDGLAPAAVQDPVEAFSKGLNAIGVAHTLTRIDEARRLPRGVSEMVQVTTTRGEGEEGGARELTATLLRCEAERTCRDLAGTYMQKAAKARPRVVQNGRLLLLVPGVAGEFDVASAGMISVFKDLRP